MRIKYRWETMDRENQILEDCKKEEVQDMPEKPDNGDSLKQLLASKQVFTIQ